MPVQEFLFTVDPRTDKNLSSINEQLRSLTNREDPLTLDNFISFDVIGYSGLRSVVIRVTMEVNAFYARTTFPVNGAAFSQTAAPQTIKLIFNSKVDEGSITDTSIKYNGVSVAASNVTLESDGYTLSVDTSGLSYNALQTHTIELISLKDRKGNGLSKQDVFSYVVGTSGSATSDRGNPEPYTYHDKVGDFKVTSFVIDRYAKIADKITEYLKTNNIDRDSVIAQDILNVNEHTLEVYILYFSDLFPSVIRTFPQEGALVSSDGVPTEAVITFSQPTHINITETNNITFDGVDLSASGTLSDDNRTLRVNVNGKVTTGNHFLKIQNLYNELGRVRPNPPIAIGFTAADIADNGGTSVGGGGTGISGITGISLPDGGTQIDGVNNPLITMSGGDAFISVSGVSASEIAINFDSSQITFPPDHVSTGIFDNSGVVISDGEGAITMTGTLDEYVSDIAISGAQIQNTTFAMGSTGEITVTGIAQDVVIDLPGDLSTITTNISTNSSNISSNSSNIATNSSDIADNTNNIASNSSNIAINSSAIVSNDTDITNIIDSLASSTGAGVLYIASGDGVSKFDNDAGYITTHYTVSPVATSVNNASNNDFIKSIFFDATGHATNIVSAQPTPASIGLTAGTGITLNDSTLDGDPISLTGTQIQDATFAAGGTGAFEVTGIAQSVVIGLADALAVKATGTDVDQNAQDIATNSDDILLRATGTDFNDLSGNFNDFTGGFNTEGIVISDGDGSVTINVADATNISQWNSAYTHSTSTNANPHGVSIGNISNGSFTELDAAVTGVTLVKTGDPISYFDNDVPYLTTHPNINSAVTGATTNTDPNFIQNVTLDSNGHVTDITAASITPDTIGALDTADLDSGGFLRTDGTGKVDEIIATSRYYDSGKVDHISGAISAEIDTDITAATGSLYITTTGYIDAVSGVLTNEIDTDITAATGNLYTTLTSYVDAVSGVISTEINTDITTATSALYTTTTGYIDDVSGDLYNTVDANFVSTSNFNADSNTKIVISDGDGTISFINNSSDNWNNAFDWGNHANAGYATGSHVETISGLFTGHSGDSSIHFTLQDSIGTQNDVSITPNAVFTHVDAVSGVLSNEIDTDITAATGNLYTTTTSYINDVSGVLNTKINTNITAATGELYTTTTGYINTVSGILSTEINTDVTAATGNLYTTVTSYVDAVSGVLSNEIDTNITAATGAIYTTVTSYIDGVSGVLSAEIDTDITAATGALYTTTTGYIDSVSGVLSDEIDADVTAATGALYTTTTGYIDSVSGVLSAEINTDVTAATGALYTTVTSYVDAVSGVLTAEIDSDITAATGALYTTITNIGYSTGSHVETISGLFTGHSGDSSIHFTLVDSVGDGDTSSAVTPNAVYDHVNTVSGVLAGAGGGSTTFTGLTDTPNSIGVASLVTGGNGNTLEELVSPSGAMGSKRTAVLIYNGNVGFNRIEWVPQDVSVGVTAASQFLILNTTSDQTVSGNISLATNKTLTLDYTTAAGSTAINKTIMVDYVTSEINTVSGVLSAEIDTDIAAINLNDLNDVSISSVADGEVLKYSSSSSKWTNGTDNSGSGGGGGSTDLGPAEAFAWFVS